jgi:hypothetical protein
MYISFEMNFSKNKQNFLLTSNTYSRQSSLLALKQFDKKAMQLQGLKKSLLPPINNKPKRQLRSVLTSSTYFEEKKRDKELLEEIELLRIELSPKKKPKFEEQKSNLSNILDKKYNPHREKCVVQLEKTKYFKEISELLFTRENTSICDDPDKQVLNFPLPKRSSLLQMSMNQQRLKNSSENFGLNVTGYK